MISDERYTVLAMTIDVAPLTSLEDAVGMAIQLASEIGQANEGGPVRFDFNGVPVEVHKCSDPHLVCQRWWDRVKMQTRGGG